MTLDVGSGGPPLRAIELVPARGRFAVPRGGRLGTVTIHGRARALRANALDRRHRTLRIGGLPAGTASVRVRLARGVPAGGRLAVVAVGQPADRQVAVGDEADGQPGLVDEYDRPDVALAHE